jgi:hypothetical protein
LHKIVEKNEKLTLDNDKLNININSLLKLLKDKDSKLKIINKNGEALNKLSSIKILHLKLYHFLKKYFLIKKKNEDLLIKNIFFYWKSISRKFFENLRFCSGIYFSYKEKKLIFDNKNISISLINENSFDILSKAEFNENDNDKDKEKRNKIILFLLIIMKFFDNKIIKEKIFLIKNLNIISNKNKIIINKNEIENTLSLFIETKNNKGIFDDNECVYLGNDSNNNNNDNNIFAPKDILVSESIRNQEDYFKYTDNNIKESLNNNYNNIYYNNYSSICEIENTEQFYFNGNLLKSNNKNIQEIEKVMLSINNFIKIKHNKLKNLFFSKFQFFLYEKINNETNYEFLRLFQVEKLKLLLQRKSFYQKKIYFRRYFSIINSLKESENYEELEFFKNSNYSLILFSLLERILLNYNKDNEIKNKFFTKLKILTLENKCLLYDKNLNEINDYLIQIEKNKEKTEAILLIYKYIIKNNIKKDKKIYLKNYFLKWKLINLEENSSEYISILNSLPVLEQEFSQKINDIDSAYKELIEKNLNEYNIKLKEKDNEIEYIKENLKNTLNNLNYLKDIELKFSEKIKENENLKAEVKLMTELNDELNNMYQNESTVNNERLEK